MRRLNANDVGYWLLVDKHSTIYLRDDNLPFGAAQEYQLEGKHAIQVGEFRCQPLWLVEPSHYFDKDNVITTSLEPTSLRRCLSWDETEFALLNKGVALQYFYQSHQYCGVCGAKTRLLVPVESAVECTQCGHQAYPVIYPCVIVAVKKGQQILLANHVRHKEEKMYTVLAGFVEPGESLEQAVQREVFEETGIQINNIRCVDSQIWAFPSSLMIGFLADYVAGEIRIQKSEIADANWFDVNSLLPKLPPQGTIARKLIYLTQERCKQEG